MLSETAFKKKVLADLKTLPNTWFIKTMERGRHGTPDLFVCLSGSFVAIELKRETGKPSKLQLLTLSKISNSKGLAMISSPSTWDLQFRILKERVVPCVK